MYVGIAAAIVQVIGLMRWPLLVPGYAADNNVDAFNTAHDVLGTAIGETLGYSLTALWTALVVTALGARFVGRWFVVLGGVAAALVFCGVLAPTGAELLDQANFIGYVLWSLWLIAFGIVLLTRRGAAVAVAALGAATA